MNSGLVRRPKYELYKNVTVLVLNDMNCQSIFVTQIL
jgi:ATP-dependent Clp protease adapter protein ClpS